MPLQRLAGTTVLRQEAKDGDSALAGDVDLTVGDGRDYEFDGVDSASGGKRCGAGVQLVERRGVVGEQNSNLLA